LGNIPGHTFLGIASEFAGVQIDDSTLTVNAYAVPEFAKGRQESKQEVWFADFELRSKSQSGHAELVAVKPATAVAAAHEFHALQAVGRRLGDRYGRKVTFDGLGFYFDEARHKVSSVTKYDHSVQSMDQIMWSRENMPTQEQVIDVFGKAAETLAMLHGEAGVAHGDSQPKNIASDRKGVRIVDLEEAKDLLTADGSVNAFKAEQCIREDLETFLLLLGGDYTHLVREYFAEPYAAQVAEANLLPRYVQLSVPEIVQISTGEQRAVPYLGPRF
ncbi:MAG: hypothetical protein ACREGB_01205, partial [Candidatus Saccharimonadales bacterium]